MSAYVIGFWTIFSFIWIILSIFIWLCVRKSKDDRIMQISSIGLEYLISQYLLKCFQKVSYLLVKNRRENLLKMTTDSLSHQQNIFVQNYKQVLTTRLLKFVRGQDIVKTMYESIKMNNISAIHIFIFPDTILEKIDYYKNMLLLASFDKISISDQEAKNFLKDLVSIELLGEKIVIVNGKKMIS